MPPFLGHVICANQVDVNLLCSLQIGRILKEAYYLIPMYKEGKNTFSALCESNFQLNCLMKANLAV